MRLIDADALKIRDISPSYWHVVNGVTEYDIKGAPTVEAIPIEWIKKYTEENRLYQSDDFDLYISDMIADWAERKENEIN